MTPSLTPIILSRHWPNVKPRGENTHEGGGGGRRTGRWRVFLLSSDCRGGGGGRGNVTMEWIWN